MKLKSLITRFLTPVVVSTVLVLTPAPVAQANEPPVANDDFVSISHEESPITLDLLANDSDPDGDELLITTVTQPPLGSVEIASDGKSVVYTAGFCGQWTDTFTYHAIDAAGERNGALVSVLVDEGLTCISLPTHEVTLAEGVLVGRGSSVPFGSAGSCFNRRCTGTGFFSVATVDFTTSPDDYVLKRALIRLPHGSVHLQPVNDMFTEPTESLSVVFSGVTVVDGTDPSVTVFITDND
jgi:hypothetical protein